MKLRKYQIEEGRQMLVQRLRIAFRNKRLSKDILEEMLDQDKEIAKMKGESYNPTLEEYEGKLLQEEKASTDKVIEGFADEIIEADRIAEALGYNSPSISHLKSALSYFWENVGGPYGNIFTTKPSLNMGVAREAIHVVEERLKTIPSSGKENDWYSNPSAGSEIDWLKYIVKEVNK
jgi:predicted house-cleaning noncanonical NTP pyrophosphatase (MazG superfamily)